MSDLLDKAGKMVGDASAVGSAAKSVGNTAADLAGKSVDAGAETASKAGKAAAGASSDTVDVAANLGTGEKKTEEPPRT